MASILPLKEAVTMWLWQQFPARIVQFCPEAKVSTHVKQTICKREIIFCPAYGITGKVSFMCEQEVALRLMTRATFARWQCQTNNSHANNWKELSRGINIKRNYNAYVKHYCLFIEKLQTTEYN